MATEPFCSHLHTHNAVKHGNLEEVEWMVPLSFVTSPQPDGGDSELLQHFQSSAATVCGKSREGMILRKTDAVTPTSGTLFLKHNFAFCGPCNLKQL